MSHQHFIRPNMKDAIFKELGIKKSGLVIGEVREALGRDLMYNINKVLDRKSNLQKYYLLVIAKNYGRDIKTTIITSIVQPPKMLGSICWLIDNKRELAEPLWKLPLDVNLGDELTTDEGSEDVRKSAKGMPVRA